jgi:uncharacterized protein YecA (UPF0149 family)
MNDLQLITDKLKNLNLNQEKIDNFTKIFKNLNQNNISLKDIHKLSHILGISPQKFGKIIKSFTNQKPLQNTIPQNKISKIGRNNKCPCNSNKKHKYCCGIPPIIKEDDTYCLCGSNLCWDYCCGSTKPVK